MECRDWIMQLKKSHLQLHTLYTKPHNPIYVAPYNNYTQSSMNNHG